MDLTQPARREVARRRVTLAVELGLQTYPEYPQDRITLRHDSKALATSDRLALLSNKIVANSIDSLVVAKYIDGAGNTRRKKARQTR